MSAVGESARTSLEGSFSAHRESAASVPEAASGTFYHTITSGCDKEFCESKAKFNKGQLVLIQQIPDEDSLQTKRRDDDE